MAYEMALSVVNLMKAQMTGLARATVTALRDDKISAFEGLGLGMSALIFTQQAMSVFQTLDKASARDLLYVLEHAQFVLPAQLPPAPLPGRPDA